MQRHSVHNGAEVGLIKNGASDSSHKKNGSFAKAKNGDSTKPINGTANGTYASHAGWNTQKKGWLRSVHEMLMPVFLLFFSPNLVIMLWYTAVHCDGSFMELGRRLVEKGIVAGICDIWSSVSYTNQLVICIILGYIGFALLLMVTLPGPTVIGPVTPKGNTPVYKDNGFYCYVVTVLAFAFLTWYLKQHGMTPTVVYDRFDEFLGTMTVFSLIFCVVLVVKGLFFPSSTDSGSTGNIIFDYYWGTELYPRIFGIDVKVFTNCRFGMTVWPLLVLIFAVKSYELHGFVDSMWVSCILQLVYFTKFFWWEAGYMRTIDIMVDRAGFYICWGCLAYIPGLYASVSLYLVNHPIHLGPALSLLLITVGLVSIVINYKADLQKQEVRNTNANCEVWGKKPEVIRAKYELESGEERESLLLVSGYWGVARHFHYIPELVLAFCWTVPAGFQHLMPYSYFIWLFLLLTHRTFRDDRKCGAKYKSYWKQYCEKVPYKMIPGIF